MKDIHENYDRKTIFGKDFYQKIDDFRRFADRLTPEDELIKKKIYDSMP